jgi:hypothetical protein
VPPTRAIACPAVEDRAKATPGRQIGRLAPGTLRRIRTEAHEELARALVASAEDDTIRQIAELIVGCERRLERLVKARADTDAPSIERRMLIAAEALARPPDARGLAGRARQRRAPTCVATGTRGSAGAGDGRRGEAGHRERQGAGGHGTPARGPCHVPLRRGRRRASLHRVRAGARRWARRSLRRGELAR